MPESVPYQAYRSKRHSQALQSPGPAPPPPLSRPTTSPTPRERQISLTLNGENPTSASSSPGPIIPVIELAKSPAAGPDPPIPSATSTTLSIASSSSSPTTGSSTPSGKRASTFRRVARPGNRPSLPPSPLLSGGSPLVHSRNVSTTSLGVIPTPITKPKELIDLLPDPQQAITPPRAQATSPTPNGRSEPVRSTPSPSAALSPTTNGRHQPTQSVSSVLSAVSLEPSSSISTRTLSQGSDVPQTPPVPVKSPLPSVKSQLPFRPGFQPKGLYRHITDDFIALRTSKRDGVGQSGSSSFSKVERMKLSRRLGKLIDLHFPSSETTKEKPITPNGSGRPSVGPGVGPRANGRRFSSLREIDFRRMSFSDAGGLLRNTFGDKDANAMRAAEQEITPWQDDASASKCPLCSASFHPLTCRKHHCRLCGQIICALPVKPPQRPAPCSFLFVVDAKTRIIEEVKEGVDYGVRRAGGKPDKMTEEDKFLKGVRICRSCRPIILRQQYEQEARHLPLISRLHQVLVDLEQEIEDMLQQAEEIFQHNGDSNTVTKEQIAMKKRLAESLTQYDTLARQLQKLSSPNGPGSSHDRVRKAIVMRASMFLQKEMVAFKALPSIEPASQASKQAPKTNGANGDASPQPDPDAQLAQEIQPLLEQEALLEGFVEEALAQRKFEDVKTLKGNLAEIRAEIERMASI